MRFDYGSLFILLVVCLLLLTISAVSCEDKQKYSSSGNELIEQARR
ncbi:MAG: hypothetical protein FWF67_06745 [Fibromonadales bacterium]|nr:hypothetical protein [Fibromonadales bacterium]